jgi:hypothetical protein
LRRNAEKFMTSPCVFLLRRYLAEIRRSRDPKRLPHPALKQPGRLAANTPAARL